MTQALGAVPPRRRTGDEPVHLDGAAHGNLLGFWAWAYSGLVGNTLRGALAEYIVALALGVAHGTRVDWDSVDIRLPGGRQVEVKSAAYLQEWGQSRLSGISFSIAPAEGWNAVTGEVEPNRLRRADVYVFCLLKHQDKETLDPLDLTQWTFYVLPTAVLNEYRRDQRTLTLSSLLALDPVRSDFAGLRAAVLAPGHGHAP
ncbi:hypothetical protein J7E97_07455 [Streptomyces sp. ISL-66]|uniref:hypothetical protein n=1 Tax=Streptomyces sp. ISL-66 TaxID=2819186 RepID=UPI001BEB0C45|nr:hypothetical protein [Streptomyces sp. ISL-66]MBT2467709.1 hypothetical protein [Streptomyces sp. ISL-66]